MFVETARIAIVAALGLIGFQAYAASGPTSMENGAAIYAVHCASCHGADFKGLKGVPDLTDALWRFGGADEETYRMQPSDVEVVVRHGIRSGDGMARTASTMPAWGEPEKPTASLTASDLDDTVAYVAQLAGQTADAEQARRGRALFNGKAACFDCHASDAKGDNSIGATDLTLPQAWLYGSSSEAIRQSIVEGRGAMMPGFATVLSDAEVQAVSAYVYSKAADYDF